MTGWLKVLLVLSGLLAFCALVWFAGPFAGYGDTFPLEDAAPRLGLIAVAVLLAGGWYGFLFWRRRRAAKALEEALKADEEKSGDGALLGTRMGEALETLKRASGKATFLYELPWYVIIGPPGVGKTTALVKSGLKFYSENKAGPAAVAGVGGTRYCDWWFTEEAVLIDTAGRYTTQDSHAETDGKSWLAFLSLLKEHRPKQPINGVILAISLEDVMTLPPEEIEAHATAIRKRLLELHKQLRIDFPVYALFTKADLVQGFAEFFGNFSEARRRKVWGATFQTEDRRKNFVGEVPAEFDLLVKRLTAELPDRLHEEPDATARIAIFGFPGQFAMLRDRLGTLLASIFEPTRYQVNANLRGFYFSSGTQEGAPIDQVLGVMSRRAGPGGGSQAYSGMGKSFFLHDLLKNVIFSESGWVSQDIQAVRRSALLRYAGMAALAVVSLALLGAWGLSFTSNRALVTSTEAAVAAYRAEAAPELERTEISRPDLGSVVGFLDTLRALPVGYDASAGTPWTEGFGLAQRPRLAEAGAATYERALERMLRPRLILRLEQQIDARIDDPIYVYEALRVYLMLGGQAPELDKPLILTWLTRDWEDSLLADAPPALRQHLLAHTQAMLELGARETPRTTLSDDTVTRARRVLERMPVADRAYTLLKSIAETRDLAPFSFADAAGTDAATVFETRDGKPLESLLIPGLYTHAGFRSYLLAELSDIAVQLKADQWVLGDEAGDASRLDAQFGRLGNDVVERYSREFIAEWDKALGNLRFKGMSAGGEANPALLAVISATEPLSRLFEAIANETALTAPSAEEADALSKIAAGSGDGGVEAAGKQVVDQFKSRAGGLAQIGIDLALTKSQRRAGDSPDTPANARRPGAAVENHFLPYRKVIEGAAGQRGVDTIVDNLKAVQQNLVAAAIPSQTAVATANIHVAASALKHAASRMPPSFDRMLAGVAEEFEGDATNASRNEISGRLQNTLTSACSRIEGLYPFVRSSNRDIPIGDFIRLFQPGGLIDGFFTENLSPHVDMTGRTWTWKGGDRFTEGLSRATLAQFQRAAQIRDAFFPSGTQIGFPVTIAPDNLSGGVRTALLSIDSAVLQSAKGDTAPLTVQWPSAAGGSASLNITSGIFGRNEVEKRETGPWAFMKLVDSASPTVQGQTVFARFTMNGFSVSYRIEMNSLANPFALPALREFRCPDSL